jgi:gliding motility-associated-like protein
MKLEEFLKNKLDNYEMNEKPDWDEFRKKLGKKSFNYFNLLYFAPIVLITGLMFFNNSDKKVEMAKDIEKKQISFDIPQQKEIQTENTFILTENNLVENSIKDTSIVSEEKNEVVKFVTLPKDTIDKVDIVFYDEEPTIEINEMIDNTLVPEEVEINDTITYTPPIIEPPLFYISKAFTPDGDGYNDAFGPQGIDMNPDGYCMSIYNRAGLKIFETRELGVLWSGSFEQIGSYIWIIQMKNKSGDLKQSMGSVLLVK